MGWTKEWVPVVIIIGTLGGFTMWLHDGLEDDIAALRVSVETGDAELRASIGRMDGRLGDLHTRLAVVETRLGKVSNDIAGTYKMWGLDKATAANENPLEGFEELPGG